MQKSIRQKGNSYLSVDLILHNVPVKYVVVSKCLVTRLYVNLGFSWHRLNCHLTPFASLLGHQGSDAQSNLPDMRVGKLAIGLHFQNT